MNLLDLLPAEMEDLAGTLSAPRYRGRQLATWIYRKGVMSLDAMTDLPKDFRKALAEVGEVQVPQVERVTPSQDGSQKLVAEMTLKNGRIVYELNGLSRPDWTTLPADYTPTGDPRWDGTRR